MASHRITESTVVEFCMMRLATDSPQYVELSEEFLRDPSSSRIGMFSLEGERIMRQAEDFELNWEGLLLAWEAAEIEAIEVEQSKGRLTGHGTLHGSGAELVGALNVTDAVNFMDSPTELNIGKSNVIQGRQATTINARWNARSTRITAGVVAASALLLLLGFSGWTIWSKSVERERLGFALATLAELPQEPVGAEKLQVALANIEQALGRNHPAYMARRKSNATKGLEVAM